MKGLRLNRIHAILFLVAAAAAFAFQNCSMQGTTGAFNFGSGGTSNASAEVPCVFPSPESDDIPISGRFLNDGHLDGGIWRPSNGNWYICHSSDKTVVVRQWGQMGDVPVPGDYDGDGLTDYAVWRPSNGTWFIISSINGTTLGGTAGIPWGQAGDVPLVANWDGDAKMDQTVWRPSTGQWFVHYSTGIANTSVAYGQNGDIPIASDYDGDGKPDKCIFRPSSSSWYLSLSGGGNFNNGQPFQFGQAGDQPYSGHFLVAQKSDLILFRASAGQLIVDESGGPQVTLGPGPYQAGDVPYIANFKGTGIDTYLLYSRALGMFLDVQ